MTRDAAQQFLALAQRISAYVPPVEWQAFVMTDVMRAALIAAHGPDTASTPTQGASHGHDH